MHQRVMALVIAVVFLGTAVVSGVAVLWQVFQQDGGEQDIEQVAQDAVNENSLKGTKLESFTPREQVSKLEVIDQEPGDGKAVEAGAEITVHYTGALAKDGTIFESSHDSGQPVPLALNKVIKGWQEGLTGMKVGGKRRLIIPGDLAYGEQGAPPEIGPNEPLVFDIELISAGN